MTSLAPLSESLREELRHVWWIGGGSVAGKSTVALRIAAARGLRVYACDDAMTEHARRSTSQECPLLHEFMAMDMDERWVNRSPDVMLDTFHWFRGEGFELIVDDLLRMPKEPGVIVEGFRLLPARVAPLLAERRHAVWLLPTPEFRQAASERRGTSWDFLDQTSDPRRARRNLLDRDRMFTDWLREETTRIELTAIQVETSMTEDHLTARIEAGFVT